MNSLDTATAPEPIGARFTQWLRHGLQHSDAALVGALAILVAILVASAPNFATTDNYLNILRQAATVGLVAFPLTLVIVSAEIDISVGAAAAFSACLLATLTVDLGLPLELAVAVAMASGAAIGAAAGAMRAFLNVPSFIVTLALYGSLRGGAFLLTNAFPINIPSQTFQWWGAGDLAGLPVPGVLMLVVFGVFLFVATGTTFGRSVFAVGGNPDAAHLSGISVVRVRVLVFALSGLLAATTGVVLASRLGSATPSIATGLEFDVISAVIIGGTSLYGGRGSMVGTFFGVMFITVLSNGMILLNVDQYLQQVVQGGVVLAAVLFTILRNRASGPRSLAL